jgi:lactoylglutathione lyase
MSNAFVHTCVRVRDIDASTRFYTALGFEQRGRLNFDSAYNVYFGLPGDGDRLELTVNVGREEPYDLGEGYNHFAITVEDLDGVLAGLAEPDGYRIELIEGSEFRTPQDGPHPSIA